MRGVVLLLLIAGAVTVFAQSRPDSAPATRPSADELKALMARIRAGAVEVEDVRVLVSGLLEGDHAIAAPWWIALVTESQPEAKLLPAEREALVKLRRAVERPEWFANDRKITLRLIRHLESVVASKDFDAARRAAVACRAFLRLVPDPSLTKLLEVAEQKIPPPKPDETRVERLDGPPTPLETDAAAAYRALVARAVAAYANAGCRPGRYAIARSVRDASAIVGDTEVRSVLERLRWLIKAVEPKAGLVFFVRTVGTARLFREGLPLQLTHSGDPLDAEKVPPIDLPAVPGDVVTIAFDEPYAEDALSHSFVIAFQGSYESRDLSPKDLFCDLAEKPGQRGAPLAPAPLAVKKSNPPSSLFGRGREIDEALRAFNTYFELPKTNRRAVDVPCLGDMIGFLKEFEAQRLAPMLIGTETDHFALVIKVPE